MSLDRSTSLLPAAACDCHMHVFDATRATVPGAVIVPPTATLDQYQALQRRLGHRRNVFVQPSSYGIDNSLMLEALSAAGPVISRGVAVVDETVTDAALIEMRESGVVGVRFNQVQAGATTLASLDVLAPRLQAMGWHIQFHLTPRQLLESAPRLGDLPTAVVLDHFARVHLDPALAADVETALWRLMSSGNVWLKLSAPYLSTSAGGPDFADLTAFTQAVLRDFPERCVWGTDWPHVTEKTAQQDDALVEWLLATVQDDLTLERLLITNPETLYRFGAAS